MKRLGETAINTRKLRIGISGLHSNYDANVQKFIVLQSIEFNDNTNTILGTNYNFLFRNFNLYGEVARSANGGTAQIHGALISLDPSVTYLWYIEITAEISEQSQCIFENSKNINESGIMIGLKLTRGKKFQLNALRSIQIPVANIKSTNLKQQGAIIWFNYNGPEKLIMYGKSELGTDQ